MLRIAFIITSACLVLACQSSERSAESDEDVPRSKGWRPVPKDYQPDPDELRESLERALAARPEFERIDGILVQRGERELVIDASRFTSSVPADGTGRGDGSGGGKGGGRGKPGEDAQSEGSHTGGRKHMESMVEALDALAGPGWESAEFVTRRVGTYRASRAEMIARPEQFRIGLNRRGEVSVSVPSALEMVRGPDNERLERRVQQRDRRFQKMVRQVETIRLN